MRTATTWPSCYAYSDSITDLPMLEAVGHPAAVNPDRALRKEAIQRGWQVLSFSNATRLRERIKPAAAGSVTLGVAGLAAARSRLAAAPPPRQSKLSRTEPPLSWQIADRYQSATRRTGLVCQVTVRSNRVTTGTTWRSSPSGPDARRTSGSTHAAT